MSFKELIEILKYEAKGYEGGNLFVLYMIEPRFRINVLFRCGQYLKKFGSKSYFLRLFLKNRLTLKYGFDTSFELKIDKGFTIQHIGNIVIHPKSQIGKNCKIQNCVTIGKNFLKKQKPIICDNVYIGTGVKIIGEAKVGNNCIIGANSVVIKSFEDNCIIAGIPAKVIKKCK